MECEDLDHNKKTHPADVVFHYNDPYTNTLNFIHKRLEKFYAKYTEKLDLESTLTSLSMQVQCAEISDEWQKLYSGQETDYRIHGMLFIYNHDGQYTKSFLQVNFKSSF